MPLACGRGLPAQGEFVPREPAPPPGDTQVYAVLGGAQLSILVSGELGIGTVGEEAARLWGSAALGWLAGLCGDAPGSGGHTFGRWIPGSVRGAGETFGEPACSSASAPSVLLARLHFQTETLQWPRCPLFRGGQLAWVSPQPCRDGSAATSPRLLCRHLYLGSCWGLGSCSLCQGGPGSCPETRVARESCLLRVGSWSFSSLGVCLSVLVPGAITGHLRAPHQSPSVSPVTAPSIPAVSLDVPLVWDMWGTVSVHPKPPPGLPLTGLAYKL